MKCARTTAIFLAVGLTMSLLLARAHPFGDAGLYAAAPSQTPIAENTAVPADVRAVLVAKCADCHSAETRMPGYDRVAGRLAPASWLMERDIVQGRKAMNLDAWESYPAEQQQIFAAKMVQETRSHAMPLLQYRVIHRGTRITDADIRTFAGWAHEMADIEPETQTVFTGKVASERKTNPVVAVAVKVAADEHAQNPGVATQAALDGEGDAVRGKDVFERRCTGCHAMNEDREGPRMQGVYGRVSGTVAGFTYSVALKQAHIAWDDASLEQWLADPETLVPGNDMDFHVAKAQERKDLIRYLKESAK